MQSEEGEGQRQTISTVDPAYQGQCSLYCSLYAATMSQITGRYSTVLYWVTRYHISTIPIQKIGDTVPTPLVCMVQYRSVIYRTIQYHPALDIDLTHNSSHDPTLCTHAAGPRPFRVLSTQIEQL